MDTKVMRALMETIIWAMMDQGDPYPVRTLLTRKNLKLEKSNLARLGYMTVGLTLSPSIMSGYNVCQFASMFCQKVCLTFTGNNQFPTSRRSQIAKTRAFFQFKAIFLDKLKAEIYHAHEEARSKGLKLAVRLNLLSDLPWERICPELFVMFSDVQFYDYTKIPGRVTPANYYLAFSRSEENEDLALKEWQRGRNVAVVFADKDLPATWHGVPVLKGDLHDLIFLQPRGILGLYAKGWKAKHDQSGFVVRPKVAA